MNTYVYEGPLYRYGRLSDNRLKLETQAVSLDKAYANFLYRLGPGSDILKQNIRKVEVEIDLPEETCYDTCEYCGTRLTDGGDCPVCDFGETDLLDDYMKLRNIKD